MVFHLDCYISGHPIQLATDICCFFGLLLAYLGGESCFYILIHGHPPKAPVFLMNIFSHEIVFSSPHNFTFLFPNLGILCKSGLG
jgi:hypothetical protein